MASWRIQVAADAKTTRVSRTFLGRRRRLLGEGASIVREAYNHPLQGAVSDILNLTTIAIAARCSYATLAYTVHDAAWWSVPDGSAELFIKEAEPIITRPWQIAGQEISIPLKWKEIRYALPG
jgi:DNA polymerase I-like protein with 3'-5' exonuclease and polymerase domains